MEGGTNYRRPGLRPLDDVSRESLVKIVHKLLDEGIVTPEKVNEVSGLVTDTNTHALAVVKDGAAITHSHADIARSIRKMVIEGLEDRFQKNMHRHDGLEWDLVAGRLNDATDRDIYSLWRMEKSRGMPDVFRYDARKGRVMFFDFSKDSPLGRRNLSYDGARAMAKDMKVAIADDDLYLSAKSIENWSNDTTDWIRTSAGRLLLGDAYYAIHVSVLGRDMVYKCNKKEHHRDRGFRSFKII